MSFDEDELRRRLDALAAQARAPRFTAESLLRRVRRRRASKITAVSGSVLAVAALATAIPVGLAGHAQPARPGQAAISSTGRPGTGPWPHGFACGSTFTDPLPGSTGAEYHMVISKISRSASGPPQVSIAMNGTMKTGPYASAWPVISSSAVVLVTHDGRVIAALDTPDAPEIEWHAIVIAPDYPVSPAQARVIGQDEPHVAICGPASWAAIWSNPRGYQVSVLMSMWYPTERPGSYRLARLAVTGPLSRS